MTIAPPPRGKTTEVQVQKDTKLRPQAPKVIIGYIAFILTGNTDIKTMGVSAYTFGLDCQALIDWVDQICLEFIVWILLYICRIPARASYA